MAPNKTEKLYPEEEGSQYKYKLKNPRRASVRAETRTYGTDSPSRQITSSDDSRVDGDHVCWKSVIEPSFIEDGATA